MVDNYFTPVSVGWNDQTGTGCIVQYANLNLTSISASVAIKLDNDVLSGSVQFGDSSVISNSNISPAVTAGNFCTLINNQVNSSVTVGDSCTITNNNIEAGITAGDGCSILSNTVVGGIVCSGSTSVISNNNIQGGQVTGGSITGNTISSVASTFTDLNGYTQPDFPNVDITGNVVSNNNITNGTVEATQTVANNVIVSGTYIGSFRVFGGWADYTENTPAITTTGSPTISGNTITGGGTYTSAFIFSESTSIVPAIDLTSGSGAATITNNTILGNSGLAINGGYALISNNTIAGDINGSVTTVSNNTIYGSITSYNGGSLTISGNAVTESISVNAPSWIVRGNAAQGITATQGNGYVLDNYVTGTYDGTGNGVNETVSGGGIGINILSGGTIERNIVANCSYGIAVSNCTGIVLNNTIIYNYVGVDLNVTSTATTINYNDIQSNGQSVVLELGTAVNINATYNWWGTTDTNAISQTIYDYKNNFNLGNVTFIPILNSANSQAVPNLSLPSPNPSPTSSPSPSQSPSPSTSPSSSPSPAPSPTPSSPASTSPSTSPTPTPTSSPTSSTSPTATATPTSTPAPAVPEFAMPAIVLLLVSF